MAEETSRLLLILVVMSVLYMLAAVIVAPFMNLTGGEFMLNFSSSVPKVANMVILVIVLIIGFIVSKIVPTEERLHNPNPLDTKSNESDQGITVKQNTSQPFVTNLLTHDEKIIIAEVSRSKEITQDSLRFRLEWSKAKLSAILSGLERMNIVQRNRIGKTNNIFLSKEYIKVAGLQKRSNDITSKNGSSSMQNNRSERSDEQDSNTVNNYSPLALWRRRKNNE